MTKERLLEILRNETYCRIQRSKIHGVGVFAARSVPKGVDPFPGSPSVKWFGLSLAELRSMETEVHQMLSDFFASQAGLLWIPEHGLNGMDISYYMNSSKNPNIGILRKGEEFRTLRRIKKGEELTINYADFDESFRV